MFSPPNIKLRVTPLHFSLYIVMLQLFMRKKNKPLILFDDNRAPLKSAYPWKLLVEGWVSALYQLSFRGKKWAPLYCRKASEKMHVHVGSVLHLFCVSPQPSRQWTIAKLLYKRKKSRIAHKVQLYIFYAAGFLWIYGAISLTLR